VFICLWVVSEICWVARLLGCGLPESSGKVAPLLR